MSFEIKDLGGLSQPLTKLIEVVSLGIGAHFRPGAIRSTADAKAYEIEAMARAEANAEELKRSIEFSGKFERIESFCPIKLRIGAQSKTALIGERN